MQKLISYPLSILFAIVFFIVLLIFHGLQWIALNLFGYSAHKRVVDFMGFFLLAASYILGCTYRFKGREDLPIDKPLIFVSNHQSMYDIVAIVWFLNKYHPKFVSKIELGRGVPGISYNLRHGGSVLIDRKDSKQALTVIRSLGHYISKYNRSAVIFPEGTRSRDGKLKRFSENGVKMLCKFAPDAYVVPLTVNNSWKLFRFGKFPLGLGTKLELIVHEPIKVSSMSFDDLFAATQEAIASKLVK